MNDFDDRFSFDLQQAIIARAHAERAAYLIEMVEQVPGLVRKVFRRVPVGKVGATKVMATAYGARC